jgi:uncharacterized protein YjbJ (UPF0337 family)
MEGYSNKPFKMKCPPFILMDTIWQGILPTGRRNSSCDGQRWIGPIRSVWHALCEQRSCAEELMPKREIHMNQDQANGQWNQVKGRAKKAWGELTDDDFKKAEGSVDKLHGIIQEKFGVTKEAIKATLEALHLK